MVASLKNLIKLNKFHKNIEFTYEEERNYMLAFLDVLLIRTKEGFNTAVYRKETNTDVYLHWNSFAPTVWKKGTLRGLVKRAFMVSSKDYLLEMELEHLREVFTEINGYPKWIVYQVFEEERRRSNNKPTTTTTEETEEMEEGEAVTKKKMMICLPYQGTKGEHIAKKIKNFITSSLPDTETGIIFKGSRLSAKFSIKDKVKDIHKHNVVYEGKCPDCDATYIGETERRLCIRTDEHAGKDKNSHMLQHSQTTGHGRISLNNMKILGSNYKNYFKRKLSEALFIKQKQPPLNIQDKSVPLLLFN